MIKSILISSMILNIGILLGRITGFIRESFVASIYGIGSQADTVTLMLSVPDVLVNILMGGALGAVLIPEFNRNPEYARRLAYQAIVVFGSLFLLLTILIYFKMEWLISIFAPGFGFDEFERTVEAVGYVIWLLPLTVIAGVTTAFLQSRNQYMIPAMGTLIINVSIIFGLWVIGQVGGGVYVLSASVLFGGILRFVSQIVKIGDLKFTPLKSLNSLLINKKLFLHYLQAVVSGSAILLFPVFARSQASYFDVGSLAVLNYSTKLIEFPLAITVTFLSVVLFPKLSKSYFENPSDHSKIVKYGVQLTLFLSIAVSSALSSISESYTSIVYGYGKIDFTNIQEISGLTEWGIWLLPLMGMSTFLTAVFNSRNNTFTPLIVNVFGLILFILIYKIGVYGYDLYAIIFSMLTSNLLMVLFLFLFLRIEGLSWLNTIFETRFSLMLLMCSLSICITCVKIQSFDLNNWGKIFISALVSSLLLVATLLTRKEVRAQLMVTMKRND